MNYFKTIKRSNAMSMIIHKRLGLFAIFILFGSIMACNQLDRSTKPEADEAPEVNLGDYEKFTLDNGLTVFVIQDKKAPKTNFMLRLDRSPIKEGAKAGYVDLAGNMIGTATENLSKDTLNEAIDFIGADLSTSSRGFYASALDKHKETLLELAADVIKNPVFDKEELEKKKRRMKSGIKSSENNPGAIAGRTFRKLIYGEKHPYADIQTEETVESVSLEDVKSYYEKYFKPNIGYMAVVGNTSKEEIKPLLEEQLGDWEKGEVPENDFEDPEPLDKPKVAVVNRPDASQSTVRIGHAVELQEGTEKEIKGEVVNTILGGGAFRLFENLREEHAYTYGAYSSLSTDQHIGRFMALAEVANNATDSAINQVLKEINKLREEPVPKKELKRAQNYITGNFALNLEDPENRARYAINKAIHDLPDDYYKNYLKNINNVKQKEVMEAAKEFMRPEQSHILVVGKADEFKGKLEQFGPVQYYDKYGNKTEAPTDKEVAEDVTAEKVIDEYIKAIGGAEKIKNVNTIKRKYSTEMRGRKLVIEQYQKRPNSYKNVTKMMGQVRQKQIYNGEKGYMVTPQGQREMPEQMLESFKINAAMFHLARLEELGIKAEVTGIKTVNDKEAYELKLSTSEDNVWREYISTDKYFKVAEKRTQKGRGGKEQTQTTLYHDYQKEKGVHFPGKISMDMGPRKIDLELNSIQVNKTIEDSEFSVE